MKTSEADGRDRRENPGETLERSSLFAGIAPEDIEKLLKCVGARWAAYAKGEMVIWEGSLVTDIGIVLSGRGRSMKTDASGKTITITFLEKGSFIGVLLAASKKHKSPVSVQALEELSLLFLPFERVIGRCANACPQHEALVRNCFDSIAEKSLVLYDRIDCLIRPCVREKILAYLTRLAEESGSRALTIPMDRSAMAEYLNVDRSALSRELSRMRRDGLIDYYKNSFKLLYTE